MPKSSAAEKCGNLSIAVMIATILVMVVTCQPSVRAPTAGFSVRNLPPESTLESPFNGSEISTTTPTLIWNSTDRNGDELTYDVYVHEDKVLLENLEESALAEGVFVDNLLLSPGEYQSSFKVLGLNDDTLYHWTVIPIDTGNATGNCTSGIWSFRTNTNISGIRPFSAFIVLDEHGYEGDLMEFDASISMDFDGYVTSWSWDFGDGERKQGGSVVSHRYRDNGSFWVTLTVTDNDGLGDTFRRLISVKNAPPTAKACCNQTVAVGERFFVTVEEPYDRGLDDIQELKFRWDFDDGSNSSDRSAYHSYKNGGRYEIALLIEDKDGGTGNDTIVVIVQEVPIWEDPLGNFVFGIVFGVLLTLSPAIVRKTKESWKKYRKKRQP